MYRDVSVFFVKQKTAYEMRISDWSSDVCSSDLLKSAPPRTTPSGLPANAALPNTSMRSRLRTVFPSSTLGWQRPISDRANPGQKVLLYRLNSAALTDRKSVV